MFNMADDTNHIQPTDSVSASVGHEDGDIVTDDINKDQVVYDYNNDNHFIGWHKEGTN